MKLNGFQEAEIEFSDELINTTPLSWINKTWIHIAIVRQELENLELNSMVQEEEISWNTTSVEGNLLRMSLNFPEPLELSQGMTSD